MLNENKTVCDTCANAALTAPECSGTESTCDVENCEACATNDLKICLTCSKNYILSIDKKQCFDIATEKCRATVANCLQCDDDNVELCSYCKDHYGLKAGF